MLTLFAIPKHFRGHFAVIQRNAILSWNGPSSAPQPEILLFGNEEGTAEIAAELGLRHFPEVTRNEFGTPLLDDLFRQAEQHASTPLLGYVRWRHYYHERFLRFARARSLEVRAIHDGGPQVRGLDWDQPLDVPGWLGRIHAGARACRERAASGKLHRLFYLFARALRWASAARDWIDSPGIIIFSGARGRAARNLWMFLPPSWPSIRITTIHTIPCPCRT